ncbi:hypothetical protein BH11ACT4_BH11ACT4_24600 [soil metagenome]
MRFESGRLLAVKRVAVDHVDRFGDRAFGLEFRASDKTRPWKYDPHAPSAGFPLGAVESIDPDLRRIGPTQWRDRTTDEVLELEDIENRLGRYFRTYGVRERKLPIWLAHTLDSTPVYFIGAHRIASNSVSDKRPKTVSSRRADPVTVTEFASEMAQRIQKSLAEYADFSQDLDSKFPDLLVTSEGPSSPPVQADIEKRYSDQNARRKRLIDTGLVEPGDPTVHIRPNLADYQLRVLDAHIRDVDKKFDELEDIASRLELFLQIVNRKFRRKRIIVDRTSGIRALSHRNEPIELTALSSGEQQEIVLAYRLLFQETGGTLVLVDEPEISLHVTWQLDLIPDLLSIAALAKLEFLVATHSPQVINDRDDLVVFLSDEVQ